MGEAQTQTETMPEAEPEAEAMTEAETETETETRRDRRMVCGGCGRPPAVCLCASLPVPRLRTDTRVRTPLIV